MAGLGSHLIRLINRYWNPNIHLWCSIAMCIHRGSKNEPPPSNGPTSTHVDRIERTRGSHLGLEPDFGSLGSMTPTKKQIFFGSVNLLHQACTWSSNIAQNILNIFMNLTPMVSGLVSRVMERGSGSMRSLFISIPRKKLLRAHDP